MFDAVLRIGSDCDLITPTITLFRNMRNGPSVRFNVPYDTGWSAVDIKQMLTSKGVNVWGSTVQGNEITFMVRDAQARYTAYWLERNRLPFESTMSTAKGNKRPNTAGSKSGYVSPNGKGDSSGKQKKGGMFDGVLDEIDDIVDSL